MNANIIEISSRRDAPSPTATVTGLPGLPCQQHDAGLWFSSVPAEVNLAKEFCQGCSQRQPCLAGALERAESAGVWGGEVFENGRIIPTKRPRGRPRKSTAA